VFNLFGGAISWMSKRQAVVALSTTESEYMAATHASKEAVWLQRLCSGIGLVQEAVRIECDSQSAIFLAKNPAYHSKTKHIDVQYHFVRDMIEEKKVSLMKVDTLKNVIFSSVSGRHIFAGPTYFRDHMILGGFSAHGFLPMVFYFRLRN
jgi:hypothetical protein